MKTFEEAYEVIKPVINSKVSFKEYKKSAHPRTFNEMFNEGGDRLAENKTYEEMYQRKSLKEHGPGKPRFISVELDVAIEYGTEEWTEFEQTLDDAYPNVKWELVAEEGPGGGWPCIDVYGYYGSVRKWMTANYFGGDRAECEDYLNEFGQLTESKKPLKEMLSRCDCCDKRFDSHDGGVYVTLHDSEIGSKRGVPLCDDCAIDIMGEDYWDLSEEEQARLVKEQYFG